jgi:anti-sigma factor RsiW
VWPSRPDRSQDRREPGQSLGSHLLNEALLQAYVDDLLAPQRRREVEESLSERPREAARIQDFQSQNKELHELFDRYLAAPTPNNIDALQHHLVKTLKRRSRAQFYGWIAAAMLVLIGIVGTVTVGPPPPLQISWSFENVLGAMRADVAEGATANLAALGFQPIGTRRVGSEPGVTQYVFESGAGRRVMLYESAAAPEDQERVSLTQEGAIAILFWASKDRAFTLVGELDRNTMLQFVSAISGEHRAEGLRAVVMPGRESKPTDPMR